MRKVALILVVMLLMSALAMPAFAAQPRLITIVPGISFTGTTAKCEASMVANNITDELYAVVRLYRGSTLIQTWTAEGNGYIFFSETKEVTAGYTYKLTVTLTVNGETLDTVYETGSC